MPSEQRKVFDDRAMIGDGQLYPRLFLSSNDEDFKKCLVIG
jgi:hypothetical protein